MSSTKVADLTVDELKVVIRETVAQALADLLSDPDEGKEIRESVTEQLLASLKEPKATYLTADELAQKLDLDW